MADFQFVEQANQQIIYQRIDAPRNLISIKLLDVPTGMYAVGNAKRNYLDAWDVNFGLTLAYCRAMERLSRKLVRRLIREKAV